MADYLGVKHCIAVSSGTAGLYLCLKACGIGSGDEVITTPYTFIATIFAIEAAEAIPIMVDVDRHTYNMDYSKIRGRDLRNGAAFMPVDILGLPIDTKYIDQFHLPIIVDACESLGNKINRPFDAMVFGLYPNKIITTGEGGVIATDNSDIADFCRAYRNQGRRPGDKWLDSSMTGFNYRMTDIQAAIGIVQLSRIDEIIHKRRRVIEQYAKNGIFPSQRIEDFSPFVFVIECDNRDKVMSYLEENGIETRNYFPSVHLMGCMNGKPGDFPVSEEISRRTLAIPYFADMTEGDIDCVCEALKNALK
jgi:perosamine synthetase